MKYIITGGLGFIGSHLYTKLKKDNSILLIDNLYSGTVDNIQELDTNNFINKDIRDKNIIDYFDEGDIVIHLAAISSLPECQNDPILAFDVNVNGTLNILEICRVKNIKKIIFASTSAVYENNLSFPFKEIDNVNPTLVYSLSKYTCEKICKSYIKNYNLNISIIRFFNVYGGNQDFRRVSPPLTAYIINCLLTKTEIILHSNGEQKRDYIYVEDLLDLILKIIKLDTANKIFNACSGKLISVNEIFKLISDELNIVSTPKYKNSCNFWDKYNNIMTGKNSIKKEVIMNEVDKYSHGDNSYASKELNWKPLFNYKIGIKDMVKNYVMNHKKNKKL